MKGSLEKLDLDFSHYDEKFHYLHPEFKSENRIDYWTGYYSNRPTLKALIYKMFNFYHNCVTFTNLIQMYFDDG
jgi:hypothetical protein